MGAEVAALPRKGGLEQQDPLGGGSLFSGNEEFESVLDILYFLPNKSKATELRWVFKGPGPEVRKTKICIFSLLPVTVEFGGKLLNLVSEISSVKGGNLMPTSLGLL